MHTQYKAINKNMSSILLYHHLGLGDHIMCHGIVREYCKKYDTVTIFSKPHNYPSVSFMYRDLKNLDIIQGDDTFAEDFILSNTSKYDEVKRIGFQNLDRNMGVPLEWQFYKIAGIPFEKKWSSFFIDRDLEKEQVLYDLVAPKKDYAFVHEDRERHYIINRNKIGGNCEIITPDKEVTKNIFDYCTIIEKAKEIHVIDSSFMFLIDCFDYKNPDQKLFIHRYARENNDWQLPILKKDWYIITTNESKFDFLKTLLRKLFQSKSLLIKRIVRKIFWVMGWPVYQPEKPNLTALIKRYVPGKSFAHVYHTENDSEANLLIAEKAGATKVTALSVTALEKAEASDVVFYSGVLDDEILKQLRSMTNQILILDTPTTLKTSDKNLTPNGIELKIGKAGFGIRERHLFPLESCFVCRAVPIK